VRELEGLLTRLGAKASFMRRELSVEFAREVLQSEPRTTQSSVTFEDITKVVCEHFSLRLQDLRSKRRTRNVALPRQLAMYFCRRLVGASYPHIGELFGRDHSTVMHAMDVTERRIKNDPGFQATAEQLERSIRKH
jgi:chromosomal replication initiator protein